MVRRVCKLRSFIATFVLTGATGLPASVSAADAPLKVYAPGELPLARYTVIKRLWVQMPESAFWMKSYPESGQAIAALVNEAARLSADGVVNLHCLNGGQFMSEPAAWYCYGNAIKLK